METMIINKDNFWEKMSMIYEAMNVFWEVKIEIYEEKDPTIRLQKLLDDPDNISYWPFDTAEEAINFLNRDLWE